MRKMYIPLFVFTMLFFAAFAFAEIRVTAVKGTAAYKIGNQWVPLQAGAVLAVGTKVSTGVRSKFDIRRHNTTVTVLPLTIMKISESTETAKTSTTRIGLRRGAVHSRVARDARIKTVCKVSTPVATASVRGSEQITICGPTIGMKDIMLKDAAEVSGPNSAPKFVSGDLQYRQRMEQPEPEST